MVPGGTARGGELSLSGPMSEADIAGLRFDTAVLSCCGLSAGTGVTGHHPADIGGVSAGWCAGARCLRPPRSPRCPRSGGWDSWLGPPLIGALAAVASFP